MVLAGQRRSPAVIALAALLGLLCCGCAASRTVHQDDDDDAATDRGADLPPTLDILARDRPPGADLSAFWRAFPKNRFRVSKKPETVFLFLVATKASRIRVCDSS